MSTKNHRNSIYSLRAVLLGAAATALALSSTALAAENENTETVIVTGSRIPQQGIVSPSPVTMVSQEELKLEGTTDVGSLMNNLPSVFAGQTSGEGNGGSGTVTVDLRGLGSARTLVLIDSKRMGPGDPEVPDPDLNFIPSALIERTEVLTGGASAVYGADAIAGVVNFIMRKDFEGVEVDANAGVYQHNNTNGYLRNLQSSKGFANAPDSVWDGESFDTTLIVGANDASGKGNVTAYFGYQRQTQVLQKDRDYSACSLSNSKSKGQSTYDKLSCAGSFNYDAFVGASGAKAGAYYFMQKGGNLTYFTGDPTMYFNYGAYNTLIRPQTRYTAGAFAHYQFDKMLDLYASFMFMDNHNSWQAAPSAAFFESGTQAGGAVAVSCDQPYLTSQFISYYCPGGAVSYDAQGNANQAQVYMARRNVEGGARVTDFRHSSYRYVVGARGDLGDGWAYDFSAQNSVAEYQQLYLYDWSKAAVQNSLITNHTSATDHTVTGCASGTCIDLFHGIGGMTDAMEQAVYEHGQRTGTTTQQVVTANVTGDLGQYGIKSPYAAEGVAISAGTEYRNDTLEEITSSADQSGDLYGAGGAALGQAKSSVHVWELFGETRIPLVHGVPYVEDLSLNAGYRYSTYSTSGAKAVHTYKYGAEWQPIDDFRLRASMQRATRAPGILDLYSPSNVVLGSYSDPCAGTSPTATAAQCALTGVTATQYGHILQCPSNQCQYLSGGNLALKPERSDTKSLGWVFTPTFVSGLTFTVDYFNIDVKDYISNVPQTVVLSGCLNNTNPGMCSYIHRGSTGSFSTTDGYINGTETNTGYLKTKGIDFELNYQSELADFGLGDNGTIALNVFGTWVDEYDVQSYTGANIKGTVDYNCVGLYGVSCGTPTPSWRHKARITWASPWELDFSFNWRHTSGSKFDGNDSNPFITQNYIVAASGGGKIAAYDYLDFATTWYVTKGARLSLGMNNVFDKNPPVLASGGKTTGQTGALNGNTFNGIYDSLGRYLFINITLKE